MYRYVGLSHISHATKPASFKRRRTDGVIRVVESLSLSSSLDTISCWTCWYDAKTTYIDFFIDSFLHQIISIISIIITFFMISICCSMLRFLLRVVAVAVVLLLACMCGCYLLSVICYLLFHSGFKKILCRTKFVEGGLPLRHNKPTTLFINVTLKTPSTFNFHTNNNFIPIYFLSYHTNKRTNTFHT